MRQKSGPAKEPATLQLQSHRWRLGDEEARLVSTKLAMVGLSGFATFPSTVLHGMSPIPWNTIDIFGLGVWNVIPSSRTLPEPAGIRPAAIRSRGGLSAPAWANDGDKSPFDAMK
jgi:hypothetical protein